MKLYNYLIIKLLQWREKFNDTKLQYISDIRKYKDDI